MPLQANGLYEFGPYRLDAAQRLLTRGDESVVLAPKTFDLLLILVESQGRVLTKKHLMEVLWPDTFVDEANLPFQVSALRRALGEEGAEWIETLPKNGYRFTAPVTTIDGGGERIEAVPSPGSQVRRLAPWVIGVGALAVITVSLVYFRPAPPRERTVRFEVFPPEQMELSDRSLPAISPDAERLVYAAATPDGSGRRLWVRSLDAVKSQAVAGTEGATAPFWSPDSGSVGFFAGGRLKRIDLHGGPPQMLCEASDSARPAGTWNRDQVIVFNDSDRRELYRVAATGGEASPVTTLDSSRQETRHVWPQFLPDGRHFVYLVLSGRPENTGMYIGSLDSKESRLVVNTGTKAAYAGSPSGISYLLFMRATTLMAQRFDARKLALQGEPFVAAEQIWLVPAPVPVGLAVFSTSDNGVLAYQTGGLGRTEMAWFDRQGKRLGTVGETADYSNPALSRDEKKLVVCRRDPQVATRDLWLFDLANGTSSRFTFDPGDERNPVWSPDGSRIAFSSMQKGHSDPYVKPVTGTAEPQLLFESVEEKVVDDWSPDGRLILFNSGGRLWELPLEGDRKPKLLFSSGGGPGSNPRFSPNGRWVTYSSAESGRNEVYVQSFPPSGAKWQVSLAGGEHAEWRQDGKELFYVAGKNLVAVEVTTDSPVFKLGTRKPLFEVRLEAQNRRTKYQVASNGQRFLVNVPVETPSPPITVVVNWTAGLKR